MKHIGTQIFINQTRMDNQKNLKLIVTTKIKINISILTNQFNVYLDMIYKINIKNLDKYLKYSISYK